ncbi:MAG: twin-arginine translocation signal domain-containing protein [Hyphomicrobiales bacterium]|nr:MAG: twin-arginine translocation signal domain-containing protein [Hyphomicrobiales bacterium]
MSLTRRDALKAVAVTAAGGTLMSRQAFAQEAAATESALMPGADVCVITPEVTEGPYYFDPKLERTDITEDHPGVATTVRLQVVDGSCKPLPGARVDLWHCDAAGQYSGYPNQTGGVDTTGQTFMRGTQFAGDDGIVEFQTTYPGWYAGRTTHMHFKVFLSEQSVLTGQIFFPDALSQFLYERVEPYKARGHDRDTLNGNDTIATQATRASFAYVKELADRYLVAMIIGVDPNATSAATDRRPPAGGHPGGPTEGGIMSFPATEPSVTLVPGETAIR